MGSLKQLNNQIACHFSSWLLNNLMIEMSYSDKNKILMILNLCRIALKSNNKLAIQVTTSNSIKRILLKWKIKQLIDQLFLEKCLDQRNCKNQLKHNLSSLSGKTINLAINSQQYLQCFFIQHLRLLVWHTQQYANSFLPLKDKINNF